MEINGIGNKIAIYLSEKYESVEFRYREDSNIYFDRVNFIRTGIGNKYMYQEAFTVSRSKNGEEAHMNFGDECFSLKELKEIIRIIEEGNEEITEFKDALASMGEKVSEEDNDGENVR